MRPWEETWRWDDERCVIISDAIDEPSGDPRKVVETDSGVYPPHGAERALIAAAPELVRVLLAIEWGGEHEIAHCPACARWEKDGHAKDCALDAALRKAGVR